jgi:hypothetical protein
MSARAEAGKRELLAELAEARAEIIGIVSALPEAKRLKPFLGGWSAAELVAHLIGWDRTNLEAATEILDGKLPSFYARHDRDWRSYNADLVARHSRPSFGDLIDAVTRSHADLLAFIQKLPAETLARDRGLRFRGWKVTIERLLKAEASDEREHARQLAALAAEPTTHPGEGS